jgi:hypothetical protein
MSYIKDWKTSALIGRLPPEASDLVINGQCLLAGELLDTAQTWGAALAATYYTKLPPRSWV